MNITLEQFEKVYNKYLPNKFTIFIFKHYAKDDEKTSGVKIKLADKITWFVLLPLFTLGLLFTILGIPKIYIGIVTISYSIILTVMVLSGFVGVTMNNRRIKKIAKELGVGLKEYNDLVDELFG